MTTFAYSRISATADRLIARFGQAATLTHTDTLGVVSSRPVQCVNLGTVKHALADSNISIGDDRLLLDRSAAPQPGDRIAYDDESRVIVDPVAPIRPGPVVIAYECFARLG